MPANEVCHHVSWLPLSRGHGPLLEKSIKALTLSVVAATGGRFYSQDHGPVGVGG
jgi:hypothetical protein